MDKVEEAIEEIDPTVFGFEDRILEMDSTAVELPEGQVRLVPTDRVRLERRKHRGGQRHKKKGQTAREGRKERRRREEEKTPRPSRRPAPQREKARSDGSARGSRNRF